MRDLEAVTDALQLDRFALLGISQGAAVSIAYAVKHPQRVSRLILYGGHAQGWLKCGIIPPSFDEIQTLAKVVGVGWGKDNPAFRQLYTSLFIPDGTLEPYPWFNELSRISTSPRNAVRFVEPSSDCFREEDPSARALDEGREFHAVSPDPPSGLTEREHEVLELIAAGLSNTQISEKLVLSQKTVNNHITHIFSKLQVATRAEAMSERAALA